VECPRHCETGGWKGVSFKVLDDPSIDTTSRTGKLVMGILALIAEFENDIRRERQIDGIVKAKDRGVKFGPQTRADRGPGCGDQGIARGWGNGAGDYQANRI
jgi:DNA invertase Pin-like site-specific DNA recombinase